MAARHHRSLSATSGVLSAQGELTVSPRCRRRKRDDEGSENAFSGDRLRLCRVSFAIFVTVASCMGLIETNAACHTSQHTAFAHRPLGRLDASLGSALTNELVGRSSGVSLNMLPPTSGAASRSPLFRSVIANLGIRKSSSRDGAPFGFSGSCRRNNRCPKLTENGAGPLRLASNAMGDRATHRAGFGIGFSSLPSSSSTSTTALRMVVTTPESIIEQASTQNLLDDLIDESVRTSARKPIMMQFNPSSGWIWRRWRGTVFSETWLSCIRNMFFASIVSLFYKSNPAFMENIGGFNILWGQLLSVTTFTLTFFLNQSYALWRKCYELSRRLQGRLNDLGMTLAAHAARKAPPSPDEPAEYTIAARQVLELVSRYVRLFNLLTYASFTRSHRPLLTPRGMRRMVERGLLTSQERQVLVDTEVPATQRHNAVLIWIIRAFVDGRQAGHIGGGAGFEQQFMEKIHVTRAQYGAIADELQGRMPLAYAHIVQVLVDVILWMYPFMAFSTGMTPMLGVIGTGLLTIFYQGLFDLAKQFLDPYDNENYGKGEDPLCVDTLIAETNSGSVRWMHSFEEQPFSSQRLQDGELFNSLLPQRGFSVAELIEREEREEAERIKKEQEREEAERLKQEQEREEAERLKKEQEEAEMGLSANETIVTDEETFPQDVLQDGQRDEPVEAPAMVDSIVGESSMPKAEGINGETVVSLEAGAYLISDALGIESEIEIIGGPVLNETEGFLPSADVAYGDMIADGKSPDQNAIVDTKDAQENATLHILTESSLLEMDDEVNEDHIAEAIDVATTGANVDTGNAAPAIADRYDYEELFNTIDWFEEKGPDGQEYRLSEMLADEEWEEESAYAASKKKEEPMTIEEYSMKAAEIIEAAENELLETEEVLKASPGAQSGSERREGGARKKVDAAIVRGPVKDEAEYYDQTQLDGISQLWGAPPDVLDMPVEVEPMKELRYEDHSFEGISQLWGGTLDSPEESTPEPSNVEDPGFDGISQLWGESDNDGSGARGPSSSSILDQEYSDIGSLWFDEVDQDGKEYRLSEMLADEVWEEERELEADDVMTLEEYSKQALSLAEIAEDEFLETEAILNAPPGASTIDVPDDIDELEELEEKKIGKQRESPASIETTKVAEYVMEYAEKVAEEAEEQMEKRPAIDDDVLEVLDMDLDEDMPSYEESDTNEISDATNVEEVKNTETEDDQPVAEPEISSSGPEGGLGHSNCSSEDEDEDN
eukprot:CAMPEP_0113542620 /NCGR_PEP_ID=MMETSP0015_2-20120614/9711_1 /TAXON_ID=2838 /ORGANISM="Odontella" /LENGTH=1232 /DNA_ID=CAMNT_0000442703 /DNA_START=10 /DNA_END=3708 /DNA_ORIENTATION=+ /assembly_acc=CAM_ASM_000160